MEESIESANRRNKNINIQSEFLTQILNILA